MSKVELEQTKGKIKLVGRVKGIGNDNSSREGFTQTEKEYKSLQFFLETSSTNQVRVELFGMVKDEVYAYSNKEKKTKKIPWKNRKADFGTYKVMGTGCYLEVDPADSSKKLKQILPEFDAVSYIKEHVYDGDFVRINGEIDYQEYVDKQGKTQKSKKFIIKSITKLDEKIDFGAEDFKEESKFEQEIVINDLMMDDESNRLVVNAKIIKYKGEVVDTDFTVDATKYPKLVANMTKRFSFGDFIKVYGLILNTVVVNTEEADQVVETEFEDWGGDEEIQGEFENNYMENTIQELQIISVDSSTYNPNKYNEEDLLSEDEDAFNGDVKDSKKPADDDGEDFEEDDDDLPFA